MKTHTISLLLLSASLCVLPLCQGVHAADTETGAALAAQEESLAIVDIRGAAMDLLSSASHYVWQLLIHVKNVVVEFFEESPDAEDAAAQPETPRSESGTVSLKTVGSDSLFLASVTGRYGKQMFTGAKSFLATKRESVLKKGEEESDQENPPASGEGAAQEDSTPPTASEAPPAVAGQESSDDTTQAPLTVFAETLDPALAYTIGTDMLQTYPLYPETAAYPYFFFAASKGNADAKHMLSTSTYAKITPAMKDHVIDTFEDLVEPAVVEELYQELRSLLPPDEQRKEDVASIVMGLKQMESDLQASNGIIDGRRTLPTTGEKPKEICARDAKSCTRLVDIADELFRMYTFRMPMDPAQKPGSNGTRYFLEKLADGRWRIIAPDAESGKEIQTYSETTE